MTDGIRKKTSNFVVKILLVLLIISFAAWGVGDMLQPAATGSSVATVDGEEISVQEVYNDFQRQMNQMRQLTGGQPLNEQMRGFVGQGVIDRAVSRTLLEVSSNDMDVAISDALVRQTIHKTEMFQDAGQFSRPRFEQVLFSNQLNEDEYIELVRDELAVQQVLSTLISGTTMPEVVAKDLYKHLQEKRSAQIVRINKDSIGDVAEATDEEIRKYYDDNVSEFMAPEYRSVTMLHITPADLVDNIDVPLEKIEDAFSARQAELVKPGRRTVEQMVFSTEEEAKSAAAEIAGGKDFAAVAKDVLGMEQDALLFGDVTKADLPEELQEAVFALGKDGISAPIQSMLGWHLVRVTAATEEVNPTFDEVKDDLRETVAIEMALEEVFGISNDVEDQLGGGATIEEAAQSVGFSLKTVQLTDKQGKDKEGKDTDLAGKQVILDDIFALEIDAEPSMKDDGEGGYYMVRVDNVVVSKPREFETVKVIAKDRVADQKKQTAAKEKADALLEKVKGGSTLGDAAKEANLVMTSADGFTRAERVLPDEVMTQLFDGKIGDVASGATTAGHVVAVLSEIKSVEGAEDQAAINALRREMANGISNDLQGQFVNALRGQYNVSIDRAMVNRLFMQEQ
ncbi:SurA N-terminal domain-containing protein [Terasakiella sp. A23]|uniref:SurA N-terminal domain-containing protein n=1 Tax=Terasakiella sp. FCG-A23 TaxID=3080561 RepID=UPI0029551C2C|nr:SurA N-terminal domain-containing protein [Terasakiella sp. A23]MDV7338894.1 SurA N-terminal domain-containing protein [Terasakiella sp. A23]